MKNIRILFKGYKNLTKNLQIKTRDQLEREIEYFKNKTNGFINRSTLLKLKLKNDSKEFKNKLNKTINEFVEKTISNITLVIEKLVKLKSEFSEDLKEVNEHIIDAIKSYPNKHIKPIKERFDNISDELADYIINAFNTSKNEYKEFIDIIKEKIKNFGDRLQNLNENINSAVFDLIERNFDFGKKMLELLKNRTNSDFLIPTKEKLEKLFSDIQNMNSAVLKSINNTFPFIERKINAGKKMLEILKNRTNSVSLMPIIEQLETIYSNIKRDFKDFKDSIKEHLKQLKPFNFSDLINTNNEFINKIVTQQIDLYNNLISFKDRFIANIKNATRLENILQKFGNLALDERFNITEKIKQMEQYLRDKVKDNKILKLVKKLKNDLEAFIDTLRHPERHINSNITNMIHNITKCIKEIQAAIYKKFSESLYSCDNEFIAKLFDKGEKLVQAMNDIKNGNFSITDHIIELLDTFMEDIANINDKIPDNDIFKNLKERLDDLNTHLNKTNKIIKIVRKFNLTKISILAKIKNNIKESKKKASDTAYTILKEYLNLSKSQILDDLDYIAEAESDSQRLRYIVNKDNLIESLDKILSKRNISIKARIEEYINNLEQLEKRLTDLGNTTEEYKNAKKKIKGNII